MSNASFPVTLLTLSLVGCLAEAPSVTPPRPPADAADDTADAPEPAPVDVFAYSPVGRRDPFRNVLSAEAPPRGEDPLQAWSIDQLQLVAVVTGGPSPYAMVEDPEGFGHIVRRGCLIGERWGRVAAIRPREIVVRERGVDATGRRFTNDIKMTIPKLPRPRHRG